MKTNLAESIRARLLNIAKAEESDFEQVLMRFALERLLYRISQSEYKKQFLLKGAMLFSLWYDMPHRPTRDMDLLGFGDSTLKAMQTIFQKICSVSYDDGITFDANSVKAEEIREASGYNGVRITTKAELAKARCKMQIDIGFGDAVTPEPVQAIYPILIKDFPAPEISTYPIYTVIAEKLHAISILGMANSRMKDYLDLHILFENEKINNQLLSDAIEATFDRRSTPTPNKLPIGLTNEFGNDVAKQKQWQAFLNRNQIQQKTLSEVINTIAAKIEGLLKNKIHVEN